MELNVNDQSFDGHLKSVQQELLCLLNMLVDVESNLPVDRKNTNEQRAKIGMQSHVEWRKKTFGEDYKTNPDIQRHFQKIHNLILKELEINETLRNSIRKVSKKTDRPFALHGNSLSSRTLFNANVSLQSESKICPDCNLPYNE